jgi:hypothetical protein
MNTIFCLLLLVGSAQSDSSGSPASASLFARGQTFEQFLGSVKAQRELWIRNAAWTNPPPDLVARLKRANAGLRLLIVAEDWCPDSVNTVPYVARLSALADVDVRIVDRVVGRPIMARHRTPDGRTASPTIVLLRHGEDVGAWVERPAVLQQLFLSMRTNPESGQRLAERQSWYDADQGASALAEFVALAEQTAAGGKP